MDQIDTDGLYAAFEHYPLRDRIDGCPHCNLGQAEQSLHAHPLRLMTWADFGVYPFKAMTTFGDVEDFKHFLPRLLELYVTDYAGAYYDVEILFHKLQYTHWESWPVREIDAVRNYVRRWYQMLSAQPGAMEESWELAERKSALSEMKIDIGIA